MKFNLKASLLCNILITSFLQRHRVLAPPLAAYPHGNKARYSLVYFVNPDDDCYMQSLTGAALYPPITYREYLEQQLKGIKANADKHSY